MKDKFLRMDDMSRRQFVANTAKTMLGVSFMPSLMSSDVIAAGSGGKAENCIFLYMSGGMTHMDTFDPKPGADTQGNTKAIDTAVAGIKLAEYLPSLAKQFKDIALVRSMNQKTADHRQSRYWMHTSYAPRATIVHPSMGPWAQTLLGKRLETLPDSVVIGAGGEHPGAGFFGPALSPLPIGNPDEGIKNVTAAVDSSSFKKRLDLMNEFDASFRRKFEHEEVKAYTDFYDETLRLMQSEDLEAFDLKKESDDTRRKYGMNSFGQGVLLAKRLVKNGVRFIEVDYGGWDMHNNLWDEIPDRAGNLDMAIGSLIEDLKAEGLFEKTLICLGTEFGRTPRINANGGRDHHPRAFSAMFAGGGIQGGQVFGKSDDKGIAVEEDPVEPKDFNATIAYAMGIPLDKVVYSPSGRPFLVAGHVADPKDPSKVLPEGKPIMQFFS